VRVRFGIIALVLIPVLAACGGTDKKAGDDPSSAAPTKADPSLLATPTNPLTEITVPCAKFQAAAREIIAAQTKIYSAATGDDGAVTKLVDELNALKDGAPSDVKSALSDLADAFKAIGQLGSRPTAELQAKMTELAPKLSADGQKITAYITSKCS
jgi:hypothetical protein